MLTDYHVHLRVDDPETTPASSAFTAANAERYREVAAERGIEELGVAEHVYRFTEALGGRVGVVEAPRENLKVTTPLDLALAERLLADSGRC